MQLLYERSNHYRFRDFFELYYLKLKIKFLIKIIFFVFWIFIANNAFAIPKYDEFLDWDVFSDVVNGQKYCYMVAVPVKKTSVSNRDNVPYFMISTHKNVDEISVSCGHYFKKDYDVELFVGLKKFFLMTYGDLAWTKDNYADFDIIKEMLEVERVVAYCVSIRNIDSFQTYSLLGFREAYYRMRDECDV